MSDYQKTIAIDFDGVIHKYSKGWQDGSIYDVPMEGAIEALERLLKRGYRVVIHTCRAETSEGMNQVLQWLLTHAPHLAKEEYKISVTDKKPKAIAYVDDRAIRFTNWADVLNYF